MKDTTKTIIIGSAVTILVLILTIFILYKMDSKKLNNENSTTRNEYNNSTPATSINNTNNNTDNKTNEINANESNANTSKPTIKDEEANSKVILYMFHGSTCPHCINAINTIKEERSTTFKNVEIRTYQVYNNKDNSTLYEKVTDKLKVNVNSVPYFIIGEYNRVGFNEEVLLKEYKNALNNKDYKDIIEEVIKENTNINPTYETI